MTDPQWLEAPIQRLFFALWPPEPLADALHQATYAMQGRVMNRAGLHVTLAFIGPQLTERVPALCEVAERCALPRTTLHFNRLQHWSKQLVVAVVDETPAALQDFVLHLHAELRAMNIRVEPRSWTPHITLLRKAPEQVLPEIAPAPWTLDVWHLVASDGRGGYRVLTSWGLQK
ncbi:MAG: RNA 2',3'-cyclic phosphodiesterase [Rhodocyclaceae bacterium]